MIQKLVNINFKEFYRINERVARNSPMQTHYYSANPFERWLWQQKKLTIRNLLKKSKIKKVVDLGCGDGGLIDMVNKKVSYVGIDISPTQIKYAEDRIKKLKREKAIVRVDDILNLKIKDDSFDAALICDVVEHVLHPEKLFKETRRLVKNNGYIIFSFPNERLLQITRALLLRFPLRSPDHINAVYPNDIRQKFPEIFYEKYIPISFSSTLSLIGIIAIRNVK